MAAHSATLTDVTVTQVPALRVVGLREQIDSFPEQGRVWKTLESFFSSHNLVGNGVGFAVHHNLGAAVGKEGKIDVEACIPVDDDVQIPSDHGIDGLELHVLPALDRVATVTLQGTCMAQGDMYTKIFAWMETHDEKQAGPSREIYWTKDADPLSDAYRCEVQVPLQ